MASSELIAALSGQPKNLDSAIELAAKHLPEGFRVVIEIEKGGYNVSLIRPNMSEVLTVDGWDGILSDINEAIRIANGFGS